MKKLILSFVVAFAAMLVMPVKAASDVTTHPSGDWVVTKLTVNASDCIITGGTLKYAYAPTARTVSGVVFAKNSKLAEATDNIEVVPAFGYDKSDHNNNDQGVGVITDTDWKNLLGTGWLSTESKPATATYTFKNLTKGNVYKVQLLIHNGFNKDNPTRSIFAPDGQEGFYSQSSTGDHSDWDLGCSLVGTFIATNTSHQLTFSYSSKAVGWKNLNAIQLRDLGSYVPVSVNERAKTMIPGDWLVCPLSGDAGDIVTRGDLVQKGGYGQAFCSVDIAGDDSLSGLSFNGKSYGFAESYSCFQADLWSNYAASGLGDCGLSGGLGTLLANGWAGNNQQPERVLNLNSLENGKLYLLQGIVHDGTHPEHQLTVAGKTITYGAADSSELWYYGGTFVHVFMATGTSLAIDLSYSLGGALLNGVQLRQLPDITMPSVGTASAAVDDVTATISISDVEVGDGWDASDATSYDVYAKLNDKAFTKVAEGVTDTGLSFVYEDLDAGVYDCTIYIVNDKGVQSAEKIASFEIGSAGPQTYVVTKATDDLTNPEDGSLRWVLSKVRAGDTVTFDKTQMGTNTIKIVGVGAVNTDTSLVIRKGVTIEGDGVTIDGGWAGVLKDGTGGRIFLVPEGLDKVTIRNLTMRNGHGRGWNDAGNRYFQGGALCALSPVRFENCSFIRNCAADESAWAPTIRGGGAIYAEADIEIFDCTFEDNVAGCANNSFGGTILLNGVSAQIERITVDGDRSDSFGGGFLYGESVPSLIIRDASFQGVTATARGGALCLKLFTSVLIERSSFVGCHAGFTWGGAVMLGDGTCGKAVFRDCQFTDCSGQCGGAVRSHANPGIFVNCTFTGGAMNGDAWGPAIDSRGNDYCINCTFTGNMFTDNNHGSSGGFAACKYGSSLQFLNCVGAFNYNRAATDVTGDLETGKDFYNVNFYNTVCNGKAADRKTDLTPESPLFAAFETRTSVSCWGNEIALKDGVVVPSYAEDAKNQYPTKVIGIAKDGLLDGTGWPVKVNADYSHICYSSDGGTTWTDFYKSGTPDDSTLAPITADQRGVPYKNGVPPIGAATYVDSSVKTGFLIIIR